MVAGGQVLHPFPHALHHSASDGSMHNVTISWIAHPKYYSYHPQVGFLLLLSLVM
jgi:hypothetical protein